MQRRQVPALHLALLGAWAIAGLATAWRRGWLHGARAMRWRLTLLDDMIAAVQGLLDERAGVVRAAVTSAQPVGEAQRQAVADGLGALTGKRVRDLPFRGHDLTWGA